MIALKRKQPSSGYERAGAFSNMRVVGSGFRVFLKRASLEPQHRRGGFFNNGNSKICGLASGLPRDRFHQLFKHGMLCTGFPKDATWRVMGRTPISHITTPMIPFMDLLPKSP